MSKLIILVLSLIIFTACQTARKVEFTQTTSLAPERNVASSQTIIKFLQRLSKRTSIPQTTLEKNILRFIKDPVETNGFRNHIVLGITDDQARKITSLTDDLPYMDKVRKWVMENITVVNKNIGQKVAQEVFEDIVVKSRGIKNPYRITGSNIETSSRNMIRNRQMQQLGQLENTYTPLGLINSKNSRLVGEVEEIADSATRKIYQKNLDQFQARAKNEPTALANGHEIVESALLITRKTGSRAMGEGCESFSKSASLDILEAKANVDLYRSRLIEDMAHAKAGRTFASIDEIPKTARLTQTEIDSATRKAFQDVLGYTDDEARLALQRLKSKPCKLY